MTQLRIAFMASDAMKPIEVDGRIAKLILALCMRRKEILAAQNCTVQFDCGARDGSIKMRVTSGYIESELGLPVER